MATQHPSAPKPTKLQLLWGLLVLVVMVLFTALMVMVAVVIALLLRLLLPWWPHAPKWVVWPYGWGLRYVMLPLAGISFSLDLRDYEPPPPGTPMLSVDVHPETLSSLLHAFIKPQLFGLKWRQVGKVEFLTGSDPLERLIGFGVAAINCFLPIDRKHPDAAVQALRAIALAEPDVVICSMLEGTRPRVQGIIDGRAYLQAEGFPDLADGLLYTSLARVRGLYELRRARPDAAVVSIWCTTSWHVEGIVDVFSLFGGGGLYFKVVSWELPAVDPDRSWEQLSPAEKRTFAEVVYRFSIDRAHCWMREQRTLKDSPVPVGDVEAVASAR